MLLPTLVISLFIGGVGRSLAQDDARAILDKAIKAHGGFEKLAKVKAAYDPGNLFHINQNIQPAG